MLSLTYAALLLFSIAGLTFLDYVHRIAFFKNKRATTLSLLIGIVFFLIWDVFGVWMGIFFTGASPYISGLFVAPNIPVEEILFLYLLCYVSLITYGLMEALWRRMSRSI